MSQRTEIESRYPYVDTIPTRRRAIPSGSWSARVIDPVLISDASLKSIRRVVRAVGRPAIKGEHRTHASDVSATLVSVVVPAFNREHEIVKAVESVRGQTHRAIEIVLVDDGSTDGTADICAALALADTRIRLVRHARNMGAQAARNSGVKLSDGEWLAFLDSDDTYVPDSVAVRLEAAARSGASVVHSACEAIDSRGSVQPFPVPPLEGNIYAEVLSAPGPVFSSLLVRRDAMARVGELDERIQSYHEWDTAIRLARTERFAFVRRPTFVYDLRTINAISRNAQRSADGYGQIVAKHRSEILRVNGRRALAAHYRSLVFMRAQIPDRRKAVRYFLAAIATWPFAPRGIPRAAAAILRGRRPAEVRPTTGSDPHEGKQAQSRAGASPAEGPDSK